LALIIPVGIIAALIIYFTMGKGDARNVPTPNVPVTMGDGRAVHQGDVVAQLKHDPKGGCINDQNVSVGANLTQGQTMRIVTHVDPTTCQVTIQSISGDVPDQEGPTVPSERR
jgi:hypothetical protein